MASVSWTATTGGVWSSGSNWSTGSAPLSGDDVTINTQSAISVTYNTGTLALDSLFTGIEDGLVISGGALVTRNGYNLDGSLTINGGMLRLFNGAYGDTLGGNLSEGAGGTLTLAGGAVAQATSGLGTIAQTAGTIMINGGALMDFDNTSLAGTLGGGGAIVFGGNTTNYLDAGVSLTIAAVQVAGGTLNLQNTSLAYGGLFQLGAGGTLSLNNEILTLTGTGALYGTVTNGGTLVEAGHGVLNNLIVNNGSVVSITGTANQTGVVTLGQNGAGFLSVAAGGVLRIAGNYSLFDGSSGGTLTNAGTIAKVGGGGVNATSTIYAPILDAAGAISVATGTIAFSGPSQSAQVSQIGGALTGAGTIEFSAGYYALTNLSTAATTVSHLLFANSANVTLSSSQNITLTYGGDWTQTGGLLLFDNSLKLSGNVAFDGGEIKGTATIGFGAASQLHLGSGMDLEGNMTFQMSGPVVQTGAINLGFLSDSVDQATLTAGNSWALEGAAGIAGAYGSITDLGNFEKLNGAQDSTVASVFTDEATVKGVTTYGTVSVDSGTLSLTGHGTLGGSVGGSAVLDIGGAFLLDTGLNLSVGEFILGTGGLATLGGNLTYANAFADEGGTLSLNGGTLTLNGVATLFNGAIANSGEVILNGSAVIGEANSAPYQLAQGADLVAAGATQQAGNLLMTSGATAPTLTIAGGGVYSIDPGLSDGLAYIGSAPGNGPVGDVAVAGTLVESGLGTLDLDTTVVDTGSIVVKYGDMAFLGTLTGGGSVQISAGGTVALSTSNLVQTSMTFGAGGGLLELSQVSMFSGTIDNFTSGDVVGLGGLQFAGASFSVSGDTVLVQDGAGHSTTLTFNAAQSSSQLLLGENPSGGLALIHL